VIGCDDKDDKSDVETHYYYGSVYDGVKGTQITKYHVDYEYSGRRIEGKIDASNNFSIGPIPAFKDFSVYIDADGYRPFVAHEPQWIDTYHADRSYHYEAYLFSTLLQVSDVRMNITLSDSASLPKGSVRLRPMSSSAVYATAADRPGGIPGQVWSNDNDLLVDTIWTDFEEGEATIVGKKLVYGVTYNASVLNVPGYQFETGVHFQAGVDGDMAITLSPLNETALAISYINTEDGDTHPDGMLEIYFNRQVEFDPLTNPAQMRESVDNAFRIASENTDGDSDLNTLNDGSENSNAQERGTSVSLDSDSGQKLTFTWDPNAALVTKDSDDVIRSVTWSGLGTVKVRPVGGKASDARSIADLLGARQGSSSAINQITVRVAP
jgi:hypothetical protein